MAGTGMYGKKIEEYQETHDEFDVPKKIKELLLNRKLLS